MKELPDSIVNRILNKNNKAILTAKKILGEEKLKELVKTGIIPIEWEVYKSNTKRRCDALKKIREIVTSPTLIGPLEAELID
jgi:hypothetical protein